VTSDVGKNLPGHNCGACGFKRCDEFADALAAGAADLSACSVLEQERYAKNRARIERLLRAGASAPAAPSAAPPPAASAGPKGLLDGYEADFILGPLKKEAVCREFLLPLTPGNVGEGDVIRYRPLGCPITHFARIVEKKDGLLCIHVVGPRHRLEDEEFRFTEIGVCMVIGFEGEVRGRLPSVGETVRFLPAECMMQKVHSGVVVNLEGRTVRIEGIDLKVWAPPIKA
jgi:uncharacterized Fe-S cluster-containing protein